MLMESCWQTDPSRRPTFQNIYNSLINIENEL
jgi:hypothetical protein